MSQNGIEIERRGWEIVPYVLRQIVPYVPNLHYLDDQQYELFHARLTKKMIEAAKESRSRAREANGTFSPTQQRVIFTEAVPISTSIQSLESVQLINFNQSTDQKVGRRKTTILVESVDFSIAVPKNFPNVDIDRLQLRLPKSRLLKMRGRTYERRYTFAERLRGWNFERRLRISENDHLDSYYLHYESKVKLRSFVEVVNFLLYEEYPSMFKRKPKPKVDKKSETLGKRKTSGEKSASGRKPKKSKATSNHKPSVESSFEVTIQEAEEFLSGFENFGKEIGSSSKGKEVEIEETDSEQTISGSISIKTYKGKSVIVADQGDEATSALKNEVVSVNANEPSDDNKPTVIVDDDEYTMDQIFANLDDLYPNDF